MKNKNILYIFLWALLLQSVSSCSKSFLETNPKGQTFENNYYSSAEEVYSGMIAAYAVLGTETSGAATDWYCDKLGPLNSAGDDCYAGGGTSTDMPSWQAWNSYTLSAAVGPQAGYWGVNYGGIYRANLILQKLDGTTIAGLTDEMRSRYIAEAKFLRAYFYFELVRLFGNIPLITVPLEAKDWYTVTQAKPEEVYAQIEKDLNDAIAVLPSVVPASEGGRATKGAATAMLGKAILFQNNESRMKDAATLFEGVITSGVYDLLPNFPDVFSPENKFNKESVFEIVHSSAQNAQWGQNPFSGNIYVAMIGPRDYTGSKYYSGWSFNPITPELVDVMKGDPRYPYTIANVDSLVKATSGANYKEGYQNTGYFIEKFAPLRKYISTVGQDILNYPNDYIEIRFSDVLLMAAEAELRGGGSTAKAQEYLNKVRARVGLPSVPATLDNVYKERRLELATEGHRWYDLVRTGKAATVLTSKGFKAGTHEVLPIPLNELNNTKLVQNKGYN
ncbi:MAG: RagB/SusD family nutrient uptake outer membrane protein [Niabella sp.]